MAIKIDNAKEIGKLLLAEPTPSQFEENWQGSRFTVGCLENLDARSALMVAGLWLIANHERISAGEVHQHIMLQPEGLAASGIPFGYFSAYNLGLDIIEDID